MSVDPSDTVRLAEISDRAIAATEALAGTIAALAEAEVEGQSPDQRVRVRITTAGHLSLFQLRDGVLRRYDSSALSELVTRTVRDAQLKARTEFAAAVAALDPPELAEAERVLRELWRDHPER
jgi:DNA-binding protein YbaB